MRVFVLGKLVIQIQHVLGCHSNVRFGGSSRRLRMLARRFQLATSGDRTVGRQRSLDVRQIGKDNRNSIVHFRRVVLVGGGGFRFRLLVVVDFVDGCILVVAVCVRDVRLGAAAADWRLDRQRCRSCQRQHNE